MDNEKTAELIFRIRKKDKEALSQLYSEMKTSVYALALVYTKSDFDAEDIMQNTFLKVWSCAESFKGKNARSWVMTIARNLALDLLRTGNRRTELSEDIPSEDCFAKIAANETIRNLFRHIGSEEREILLLYSYGYTFGEIASVIKKPKATVHLKYSRAIKKLRNLSGG